MRQNARKRKPNPSNNPPRNIRSSSIRAIIGDRRFNDQFNHVKTNRIEGTKKVRRMKVDDAKVHDLPNLGRNASSNQSEAAGDPRGCSGDLAAKTSEYAFFKRMKGNTCSNVHADPNCCDNQLSNVQNSRSFTREEIPNVQKESIKYARSSSPNEKEQNEAHYSFLSPPCHGFKNSAVSGNNVQNVRPGEYNRLSPSVGSKMKTRGIQECSLQRGRNYVNWQQKDCHVMSMSSLQKGLIWFLLSLVGYSQWSTIMIDPNQDETDYKHKLPPFSESEAAKQIKRFEAYKSKLMESQYISYLDDGLSRPTKKPIDNDLLEWNPTGPESFSCSYSPNFNIQYNRCQIEGYKREFIKSHHISYLDDCFSRSAKKPTDMDILEWNPSGFSGLESSIRYNHHRTAGSFRFPNFDMESILAFDKPLHMHLSRNFQELDESHLYNEPKLLEQPQTLLLGWDHNSEKDESFLRKEHLLTSSISPYTPTPLMAVEDCSIRFPLQDYNTWCVNESVNEPLSFQYMGLHSLVNDDENKENFVYGSDLLLKGGVNDYSSSGYMNSFLDKHFDRADYPLLLHDSSWNDEC
ncbi:hypothetical protein HanRHA438_Chr04g0179411 [Helianthus annuus]|nr:hypothetical protein HanRHA438_Chr04g0179411 [Helianthus annuus]